MQNTDLETHQERHLKLKSIKRPEKLMLLLWTWMISKYWLSENFISNISQLQNVILQIGRLKIYCQNNNYIESFQVHQQHLCSPVAHLGSWPVSNSIECHLGEDQFHWMPPWWISVQLNATCHLGENRLLPPWLSSVLATWVKIKFNWMPPGWRSNSSECHLGEDQFMKILHHHAKFKFCCHLSKI